MHGYGPDGAGVKAGEVGAARVLIDAGAIADTANRHGLSAFELARNCARHDMYDLLRRSGTGRRD